MSCMRGDTACPSCGEAQGCPADEAVEEWLYWRLAKSLDTDMLNVGAIAHFVAEILSEDELVVAVVEPVAVAWLSNRNSGESQS